MAKIIKKTSDLEKEYLKYKKSAKVAFVSCIKQRHIKHHNVCFNCFYDIRPPLEYS